MEMQMGPVLSPASVGEVSQSLLASQGMETEKGAHAAKFTR
jgi:hypothetical protein